MANYSQTQSRPFRHFPLQKVIPALNSPEMTLFRHRGHTCNAENRRNLENVSPSLPPLTRSSMRLERGCVIDKEAFRADGADAAQL